MTTVKFTLRLYRQDADLIRWLDGIREGDKNRVIKEVLRRGIEKDSSTADLDAIREALRQELTDAGVSVEVDLEAIQQAIQEAVGESTGGGSVDLAAIRRIVDAALSQAMNGLSLEGGSEKSEEEEESEEDLLGKLNRSLGIEGMAD